MTSKLPTIDQELASVSQHKTSIRITPDKSSISKAIDRVNEYKALPRKFRPALESVADYVRQEMIADTFSKEGPGWPKLARRTQVERDSLGYGAQHPILKRTGDLYSELTEKSHPKHIEVIRTGKLARIEIGGSSKKFVENQMGMPGQRLPSRPMIPGTNWLKLRDRDRVAINNIIKKSLVGKQKK